MDTNFLGDVSLALYKRGLRVTDHGIPTYYLNVQDNRFPLDRRTMAKLLDRALFFNAFSPIKLPDNDVLSFCVKSGLVHVLTAADLSDKGVMEERAAIAQAYDQLKEKVDLLSKEIPYDVRYPGIIPIGSFLWKSVFQNKWKNYQDLVGQFSEVGHNSFNLYSAVETEGGSFLLPTNKLAGFSRQFHDGEWYRNLNLEVLVENWADFFSSQRRVLSAVKKGCDETGLPFEKAAELYISFLSKVEILGQSHNLTNIIPAVYRTAKKFGGFSLDHETAAIDLEEAATNGSVDGLLVFCYSEQAWKGEYGTVKSQIWKSSDMKHYAPKGKFTKGKEFAGLELVLQPAIKSPVQESIISLLSEYEAGVLRSRQVTIGSQKYNVSIVNVEKGEHEYTWHRDTGLTEEVWIVGAGYDGDYGHCENKPIIEVVTSKSPMYDLSLRFQKV